MTEHTTGIINGLNTDCPFQVTHDVLPFQVINTSDDVPSEFTAKATTSEHRVIIRICGGCSNMSEADKQGMIELFVKAFSGFKGVTFTGATRDVTKDGKINPMITDLAGAIAYLNPGSVALGTFPRTGMFALTDESRLTIDCGGWFANPNPNLDMFLIVQDGSSKNADWDGDLHSYFRLMEILLQFAGFSVAGHVFWNGGGVTKDEIIECFKRGWPAILIEGSGRMTDEIIGKLRDGNDEVTSQIKNVDNVAIVSKDDPDALRSALIHYGFLSA